MDYQATRRECPDLHRTDVRLPVSDARPPDTLRTVTEQDSKEDILSITISGVNACCLEWEPNGDTPGGIGNVNSDLTAPDHFEFDPVGRMELILVSVRFKYHTA